MAPPSRVISATRAAPSSSSMSEKIAELSSTQRSGTMTPLPAPVAQERLAQPLTAARPAQELDRIAGRQRDHPDSFAVVQPGDAVAILDVVALADPGRNGGLPSLGHRALHFCAPRTILGSHTV